MRRIKKDWPEITTPLKIEPPCRLPIYVNGEVDITCKSCLVKPGSKKRGGSLFYCTNKNVINELKVGLILNCTNCMERNKS